MWASPFAFRLLSRRLLPYPWMSQGKRFKIGLVALVDSDQLRLFKALNAKAVITGTSRHAELARTLTTVDMYDAMRGSFAKLGNTSFAYGTASLVFASASLSELSRQYSKALPRERSLLGANFAAGRCAGGRIGDAAGRDRIEVALVLAEACRADGAMGISC